MIRLEGYCKLCSRENNGCHRTGTGLCVKAEQCFLIDPTSGLMFDGETWTEDPKEAKLYPHYSDALVAGVEFEMKQKSVVAELSAKFGG